MAKHLFQVSNLLYDLSMTAGCNDTDYENTNVNDTVVLVARGDCNFSLKARLAQARGAVGLLIASDELVGIILLQ